MVREQILGRGLRSRRVLGAFLRVDRRAFVPAAHAREAFGDHPVLMDCGQTVSQPYMIALMLDALRIGRGMKVLEVGAGSGYVLALLHVMGVRPFGVEWHGDLARGIAARLRAAGLPELPVRCGDGGLGWPEEAPFDRILISAACPRTPEPLLVQLAPGGILAAPVDNPLRGGQVLETITRTEDGLRTDRRGGCVFVPLVGRYGR